jgi:sodium/hydrogen antiporter
MALIAIFLTILFLYSLGSRRLKRTVLTAPILFTAIGFAVLFLFPEMDRKDSPELFLRVAEIGLCLLLFSDAATSDLGVLRNIRNLPGRLLSVGMLLTILLGGGGFSRA